MSTLESPAQGTQAHVETADGTQVDAHHPWLGLSSFTEESRGFFHGREEEVAELSRRVQRKLLTVLFGQSGLGKTSILRAGIVPRLRGQGYCPVYVRMDYGPDAPDPARQVRHAIAEALAAIGGTLPGETDANEGLWELFHRRDHAMRDDNGKPLIPLLIFDQFEEIFTLAQSDAAGRAQAARFIESLAELVENRPSQALEAQLEEDDDAVTRFDFMQADYRVLIALREDYLAHLESLKAAMPSITQNRLRLAPMTGVQALAAVRGPGGALVSEEVSEAIVRFVAGGAELQHAQVEPSLLSLICRELNDKRIAQGRSAITLDLLAGSHESILGDFYERALADQSEAVRRVIEDSLLTESGYRENVAEERVKRALDAAGAAPDALATLVNRRLLRIEERLDVRRVELTHDVLCGVVAASRARRHEREARDASAREQQALEDREVATRRALKRSRLIAAASLAMMTVAIAGALFGYVNLRRANESTALVESSRADAEKLAGYLLDDVYAELEPTGRLGPVAELAERMIAYYDTLPAALRSEQSTANHALAMLRLGDVRRTQGRLVEADALLRKSVVLLEPQIKAGHGSEAARLTLADALRVRGLVSYAQGNHPLAIDLMHKAVGTISVATRVPSAPAKARRIHALAQMRIGYMSMRAGSGKRAVLELQQAKAVLHEASYAGDPRIAIVSSDIDAWLHEALIDVSDFKGSDQAGDRAVATARALLKSRPGHVQALGLIERVQFMRGDVALEHTRKHSQALSLLDEASATAREILRIEPQNQSAIDGISIAQGFRARAYEALGEPQEAIQAGQQAFAPYAQHPASAYQSKNLVQYAATVAQVQAELGMTAPLERSIVLIRHHAAAMTEGASEKTRAAATAMGEAMVLTVRVIAGGPQATPAAAQTVAREARRSQGSEDGRDAWVATEALAMAQDAEGNMSYSSGDYARAAQLFGEVLQASIEGGGAAPGVVATLRTNHGLALARSGRAEQALPLLNLALQEQRRMIAAGSDDQRLRLELAETLYALAWADPAQSRDALREATALLKALPAPMQAYRTVRTWRARVTQGVSHGPTQKPAAT